MVDREFLLAQNAACIGMMARLMRGEIDPKACLPTFLEELIARLNAREEELSTPSIRLGRDWRLHLEAVRRARELYLEEAGVKYLREVLKN